MKVKLLISRSGLDGAFNRGDEIEVSTEEGKRMIEAGQATPVRSAPVETAKSKKSFEKAAK